MMDGNVKLQSGDFKTIYRRSEYTKQTSGQSYKHFTLVIYDSRVVIWGIFKSGTTLESYFTSVKCL